MLKILISKLSTWCWSNVLISDNGFSGLVIVPQLFDFEIIDNDYKKANPKSSYARHHSLENSNYDTDLANSFDFNDTKILLKVGSSYRINSLINKLNQEKISGLEWFYGIPGTIGGATYMNIHGGNYFFADFIQSAEVFIKNGDLKKYTNKELI
jgi:UDP-N-acetylmuramate dehydrogenase